LWRIIVWEKRIDVFSSHQPEGLMNRLMGHNMTRKDGAEHLAERKVFLKAVSPQAVKEVWIERFRTHAQRILCHRGASGVLSLAAGRMRQAPRDAAVQVWDMDQRWMPRGLCQPWAEQAWRNFTVFS
jgi:hypothetical protein